MPDRLVNNDYVANELRPLPLASVLPADFSLEQVRNPILIANKQTVWQE